MEYFLPPCFNYYKTLLSFTIIQICENLTRLVVGILVAEVTHLLRFHDFFLCPENSTSASRPTPPLGVPTDLKSVVKKGSTYQTRGFIIP